MEHYKLASIGIDQSYKRTGISLTINGVLVEAKLAFDDLDKDLSKQEKRVAIVNQLDTMVRKARVMTADEIIVVLERTRLRTGKFINFQFITDSIAVQTSIIDYCYIKGIPVYSVDTRAWKTQVIGTTERVKNDYGVPEEKWLTVKYALDLGLEDKLLREVTGRRGKQTFVRNDIRYEYIDDIADSIAISMFPFTGRTENLHEAH